MTTALDDASWVRALGDPGTTLVFPWSGYDRVSDDWAYHDRILPDHLIYLLTDGEMVGTIDRHRIRLGPGMVLWMQPGTRHTFALHRDAPPPTLYFVRFQVHTRGAQVSRGGRSHQRWEDAWDLRGLMDELIDELGTRLPHRESRLRALLLAVCTAVLRLGETDMTPASGTLTRTQRRLIEGHVRADPTHRTSPGELAALVGLTPDYFTRLFTRTFGVPPRVWLVRERLDRAARALTESTRTVSAVARSLGYQDVTAFSHQFKQHRGLSPRDYRRHRT